MAAPSFQDYFDAGKAEAINRRPELTFDEGDISEFLVAAMAAMADHLTGYFAGRFKATYLDGAEGDDLTTLADDHWNVQRFPATAATGTVSFVRTNGNGAPAGTLAAGFVVATAKDVDGNEVQYTLDADLNWSLAELGPKTATVTCTATGLDSNADLDTVNRVISTPFDSTITVNNPASKMAGGDDEETDADLRERVRNLPATLRRGTLAAIEYGALQIEGVKRASAVEEEDEVGATGIVDLYVTDIEGNSSPTMIDAVEEDVINWRAGGVIVNVYGGALSEQDVTLSLNARLGTDTVALASKVVSAVTARINKLKIGETLSRDLIRQAALNVDENILSVTITLPATDITPDTGTIIRAGTVTVS